MTTLRVASLFSGCGGKDVGTLGGFDFLGNEYPEHDVSVVFANDIDKFACELYEENFDHGIVCDDVRNIGSGEVPDHDLLTGGFPCVSFSVVARNPPRLGFKSEEGRLYREMIRVLKDKKPKGFVAENVKGILSANGGDAFPVLLKEFELKGSEHLGYNVGYAILDSADFGVPQKRERVFIIGYRNDLNIEPSFPSPTHSGDPVPLKKVIFDHDEVDEKFYFSKKAVKGLKRARRENPDMKKGRPQNPENPCNTVGAHLKKLSLNSTDPVLKVGKDIYRRFTPREVARIQSFPDTYTLLGPQGKQYEALGNAIPPVVMWHVVAEVIDKLSQGRDL